MVLAGLKGDFEFESFIDYLKNANIQSNEEIRILAYISDLTPEDLFDSIKRFNGFRIKQLGEITEVSVDKTKEKYSETGDDITSYSYYYCYYEFKKNLLLCFTTDTIEEIDKTLEKFINHKKNIFPLWIPPLLFDEIRRDITNTYSNTIISEFHASTFNRNMENVIRENYNRYFKYIGDDGKFTLDEISRAYGILPTSILFNILNIVKFRITNKGRFTFIHGNIHYLFEIINSVLSKVMETKNIIGKSKIEIIPVNMGRRNLMLRNVIPIDIKFSREIEYTELEQILENMVDEDFNFEMIDFSLIPGSIHLSGTIIDKNKNAAFYITGNSEKITLSPKEDTRFDSLMQFYRLVVNKLDLKAKINLTESLSAGKL